jgi:hypothetical protein
MKLLWSLLARVLPSKDTCWCPCADNPYLKLDAELMLVILVLAVAVGIAWWNDVF